MSVCAKISNYSKLACGFSQSVSLLLIDNNYSGNNLFIAEGEKKEDRPT